MYRRLTSSAGFTLIAAMTAVVIIGIMLGATGQSWKMFMKREKEEELMFRGIQYRNAIKAWYNPNLKPGQAPQPTSTRPLKDLKYLLQDPNSASAKRYLRKLYIDPITNEDFVPVLDANQAIVGVASSSKEAPLKVGNFPDDMLDFAGKRSYEDWKFVYRTQPFN